MAKLIRRFIELATRAWRPAPRIASVEALVDFLHSRSALVAQTALYGYLRTRMGTRYPEIFQDDRFTEGLEQARAQAFLACLADLTVHTVAVAAPGGRKDCERAVLQCFRLSIGTHPDEKTIEQACDRLARRLTGIDWAQIGHGGAAFTESPAAVIDAAPVSEAFREQDREIVENSVRLRWVDVRRQLHERIDRPSLSHDLRQISEPESRPGG